MAACATFLATFIILLFVRLAPAETTQGHFVWPNELFSLDWNKCVKVKVDLPYLPLDDGPKPTVRTVYYLDLNDDGAKEMIVYLGRDGVTTDFAIFQCEGNKWKEIGVFIGLYKVCAKANGYYQLESGRQYGGGTTGRTLYRFIHGRYRPVCSESYERGILSNVTYNPTGMEDDGIIYDRE